MGVGNIRFDDISGTDLEIEARGPVRDRGGINVQDLNIKLAGKSDAELTGRVNHMSARVELASRLRAYDLLAQDAIVEVSGASFAKVNVQGTLEVDEGVARDVDYRGNPHVVRLD